MVDHWKRSENRSVYHVTEDLKLTVDFNAHWHWTIELARGLVSTGNGKDQPDGERKAMRAFEQWLGLAFKHTGPLVGHGE